MYEVVFVNVIVSLNSWCKVVCRFDWHSLGVSELCTPCFDINESRSWSIKLRLSLARDCRKVSECFQNVGVARALAFLPHLELSFELQAETLNVPNTQQTISTAVL